VQFLTTSFSKNHGNPLLGLLKRIIGSLELNTLSHLEREEAVRINFGHFKRNRQLIRASRPFIYSHPQSSIISEIRWRAIYSLQGIGMIDDR